MIGHLQVTSYGSGRVLATLNYTPVHPDHMTPRERHEHARDLRDLRKLMNRLPRRPATTFK